MIKKHYLKKDKEKAQFIEELSEKDCHLTIFFDEAPQDFLNQEMSEGKIVIKKIEENVYEIKPPYSYELLQKWLYFGNWQAIYPPKIDFVGMDTFREKGEKITNYMVTNGIEVLIDSFHDNIEWNIFTIEK